MKQRQLQIRLLQLQEPQEQQELQELLEQQELQEQQVQQELQEQQEPQEQQELREPLLQLQPHQCRNWTVLPGTQITFIT
jgi:hypothetical protein